MPGIVEIDLENQIGIKMRPLLSILLELSNGNFEEMYLVYLGKRGISLGVNTRQPV